MAEVLFWFLLSPSCPVPRIWWQILMNLGFSVATLSQVNSPGAWRFLHCCFVSTSRKTLPDFMGLTLPRSAFAIPSIAFFSTNAFKLSGIFLSAASMMRNFGNWLSSWFSLVWFEDWFWVGVEVEHGGDVLFCLFMLIMVWWGLEVCLQDLIHKWWSETNFAKNTHIMTHTKNHSNTHGYPTPKRQPPSMTYSPPSNALVANFISPQGRISPPPLGWGCPV